MCQHISENNCNHKTDPGEGQASTIWKLSKDDLEHTRQDIDNFPNKNNSVQLRKMKLAKLS